MLRDYSTGEAKSDSMFVGLEVEATSCYQKKTLFVPDINVPISDIVSLADTNNAEHVYLGANKNFANNSIPWGTVYNTVDYLIKSGFDVTMDIPAREWEGMLFVLADIVRHPKFHVNVSVELPHITEVANVNVKVDDIDFNATNPGVWVFNLNSDHCNDCFNDWSVYSNDAILK